MRPATDIRRARDLVDAGWPLLRVAKEIGIPRSTIRDWRHEGFDLAIARRMQRMPSAACDAVDRAQAQASAYAYLFGQYLGDGTIDPAGARGVFKLRIFCCSDYPGIIGRCVATARDVLPRKVATWKHNTARLVVVSSHWKHMPCLFPQHGPGRKHDRPIVLAPWQDEIVVAHPQRFLRGLIESDGCRTVNRVNGGEYPRYLFSNASDDIRALFVRTTEQLGLHWTTANARNIAISRRPDVEVLDSFIGPKR